MKKKILGIGIIAILIVMLFIITRCGNINKKKDVVETLNSVIDKLEEESSEYHVRTIESAFKDNTKYTIIDASRQEFTELPSSSKSQFGSLRYSEQLINVGASYVLIYDTENEEYYSVSVSYESYKPVFVKATKLK
ncbi:MAG: hypothetical protein IJE05_03310 [Clostridia bacterium]|nr:hypothetical protein [Clostridia bacterium]